MRIRSTKPEFWRSERVALLSWDARLVLKGLESYVDDNGVGKDDMALILGDVFSRDMLANPRDTLARVSASVSELAEHGFLHRYEADGTRLLYLSWWDSNQRIDRPGKGRLPRPDGTMDYKDSEIRDSVASPRDTLAPGTGEQGNRGTDEQGSREAAPQPPPREDVEQICGMFADLCESTATNGKRPTITQAWRDAARRLIDLDGRTVDDIERIARWALADDFWVSNVRSLPKLREKFETLTQQAQRPTRQQQARPNRDAASTRGLVQAHEDLFGRTT